MAQDILITPKATTPSIAYTGNGGGAATVNQKVLSTSIIQFESDGSVLLELDPVASTVSALGFETNSINCVGTITATAFSGNGASITGLTASAIDHGGLAGIADDDHTQYIIDSPGGASRNEIIPTADVPALVIQAGVSNTGNMLIMKNSALVTNLTIDTQGNLSGSGDYKITGSFQAEEKSFVIDHPDPAKVGWKLQYGCLEGPENGVYVRGRSSAATIDLPDYWPHLVQADSITVHLTPVGQGQTAIKVADIVDNVVHIEGANDVDPLDYFYIVNATRKDVANITVEHPPA
jgi:hypothetical protein